jgi:hypothetical protein
VTGQNGSFAVAVPGSTHFYSDAGTDTITVTVTRTANSNTAPTNLRYFLAIDGLNGGSTDAAHAANTCRVRWDSRSLSRMLGAPALPWG